MRSWSREAREHDSRAIRGGEGGIVTDEQGRRRFHGAFTGGFSAGYFNTCGSEEGWTPSGYASSRNKRHRQISQRPQDFMDEEDDPLMGKTLDANRSYRIISRESDDRRTSAGTLPADLVVRAAERVGEKMLMQMGWRPGKGVGPRRTKRIHTERGHAYVGHKFAPEDVAVFVVRPKTDTYGIGFVPRRGALRGSSSPSATRRLEIRPESQTFALFNQRNASNAFAGEDMLMYDTEIRDEEDDERGTSYDSGSQTFQERCSDGVAVPDGWRIQRHRRAPMTIKKEWIPSRPPSNFKPFHRFEKPLEMSAPRAIGDMPTSETNAKRFDPKREATSLIQRHNRARELKASQPPESVWDRAVSDAERSDKQDRVVRNVRQIASQLSSRFRPSSSASSEKKSSTTHTPQQPLSKPSSSRPQRERRVTTSWKPDRLLCKRFGVSEPIITGSTTSRSTPRRDVRDTSRNVRHDDSTVTGLPRDFVEDRSTPLLSDRPGIALFRSIFANDTREEEIDEDMSTSSPHSMENTNQGQHNALPGSTRRRDVSDDVNSKTSARDASDESNLPSWALRALGRTRATGNDREDEKTHERKKTRKKKKKKKKKKKRHKKKKKKESGSDLSSEYSDSDRND